MKKNSNEYDLFIIEKIRGGDKKSFEKIYSKYLPYLNMFVFKKIRDKEISRDLVQEIMTKVYFGINKYTEQYTFSAYFWGIANNHMVDHYRKTSKLPLNINSNSSIVNGQVEEDSVYLGSLVPEEQISSGEPLADDSINSKYIKVYVKDLLDNLNDLDRKIVCGYFLEQKSYEEIAEENGISINNLKVLLFRAKKKLKKSTGKFNPLDLLVQ